MSEIRQPWYDRAVGWALSVPSLVACIVALVFILWIAIR